jgi:trans-2,3-dihydro-3-hydroxyanthranilate isomerase
VANFRYVVVDVFTEVPFAGNQLAVFTDARGIPEERLQDLAREINFSETVFVYPAAGDGHALMRIFTPALELPFAGHPVLGTAFVLGGPLQLDELWLETGAGVVPVRLERDGSRIVFGWMQ